MIDVGTSVFSSTRRDHNDFPVGGVVVAIEDAVDPTTGEMERWFTCVSPYAKDTVHRLAESEVGPEGIETTTNSRLAMLLFNAAVYLVKKGTTRSGIVPTSLLADSKVKERVAWMHRLMGVAAGGPMQSPRVDA